MSKFDKLRGECSAFSKDPPNVPLYSHWNFQKTNSPKQIPNHSSHPSPMVFQLASEGQWGISSMRAEFGEKGEYQEIGDKMRGLWWYCGDNERVRGGCAWVKSEFKFSEVKIVKTYV